MLTDLSWPILLLAAVIATDLVILTGLIAKELRERRVSIERKQHKQQVARGLRTRVSSLSEPAPSR